MALLDRTRLDRRRAWLVTLCGAATLAVFACSFAASVRAAEEPPHSAALDDAIVAAAKRHGVPESLVRRIIMRESKYNPRARNHSFWGLMQISYPTARSMGFTGTREELLNPVVNLRYAVPYLANAFIIAGKREDAAVRLYAAGYYFTARSRGLLSLLRTANSPPLSGLPDDQPVLAANAVAQPPQSIGIFGALFGPGQQPQPTPQIAAYSADASPSQGQQASQPGSPPQPGSSPQPGAQASAAPAGTFNGATVEMVADRNGGLAPPKKWTRDGGMTSIARGEQGLDQIPDHGQADGDAPRKGGRRHQKITTFAALDLPPATAQAYAGGAAPDPRFAGAPSQAAIADATSGQGGAAPMGQPVVQQSPAAQQSPAVPPGATSPQAEPPQADATPIPTSIRPTTAEEDKPAKRQMRQVKHHKTSGGETKQALADKPADAPPLRTTQ